MFYKPRKIPVIRAFKFDKKDINSEEYRNLKIEDPSTLGAHLQGNCQCGRPLYEHGIIKGVGLSGYSLICPGYYIIYEKSTITNVMSPENFEAIYKPYIDPEDVVAEI